MKNAITVLVVDDSIIFRNLIIKALKEEGDIEVIGSVENGKDALKFIEHHCPDVITLDVEMPGLDGMETLEKIKQFNRGHPESFAVGVIMVSAFTRKGADTTIKALQAGAFDFITKPNEEDFKKNIDSLRRQLLVKIRHFSITRSRVNKKKPAAPPVSRRLPPISSQTAASRDVKVILFGVSTGGPKALVKIIPEISRHIMLPIFIVQHMPPTFTHSLADALDRRCRHRVIEAEGGEVVDNRTIYLAPGGKHLLMGKNEAGEVTVLVNNQLPENGFRPSVDILFRSAARVYGGDIVAVILTGMGSDGTRGLGTLKRMGAYAIAQDEETSIVWGMPGSAVEAGYVDEVLPLIQIPATIRSITGKKERITLPDTIQTKAGDS